MSESDRLEAVRRHLEWLTQVTESSPLETELDQHLVGFPFRGVPRSDRTTHAAIAGRTLKEAVTDIQLKQESDGRLSLKFEWNGWDFTCLVTAEEESPYRITELEVRTLPKVIRHGRSSEEDRPATRVLFVGHSYIFFNNMPGLLTEIASAAGEPMDATSVVAGGATLEYQWNEGTAVTELRDAGPWDFVVLTDQSMRPITDPELTIDYGARFIEVVHSLSARPVIFNTWARRDRPEEQVSLDETYMKLAQEHGALVAPVGQAFQHARLGRPELSLYREDGSHPEPAGSYLAACVLFSTIFGRSPLGLNVVQVESTNPDRVIELSSQAIAFLQSEAWLVCKGHPSRDG